MVQVLDPQTPPAFTISFSPSLVVSNQATKTEMTVTPTNYPPIRQNPPTISRAPSRVEENVQRLAALVDEAEGMCRNILAAGWVDGAASAALMNCGARLLEASAHATRALNEQARFEMERAPQGMREVAQVPDGV